VELETVSTADLQKIYRDASAFVARRVLRGIDDVPSDAIGWHPQMLWKW
jgi:hypothetical protein